MISACITKGAMTVISEILDNCCQVRAGDEVLIVSHIDGLQGGDNLVDEQTVAWLQQGVTARGANASVLWIDEPAIKHNWRVPPVLLSAMRACDVLILNSFDLTVEELRIVHEMAREYHVRICRNFATTVGLLNSPWAQTPYELVNEIRYEAGKMFDGGVQPYILEDANGTHLEGFVLPSTAAIFPSYAGYRANTVSYRPFPEWVYPPINISKTNGVVIFDRMLSWWSRYIGIPPVFSNPIELTIQDGKITKISGKGEAEALRCFVSEMEALVGDVIYDFPEIHGGVHPCALVGPQQCNHPLITRIVDHSDTCNVHFHIGAPFPSESYPYWAHITGDLQNVTWRVGDKLVYDNGRLTALDLPRIKEIAAKYPNRPGADFTPRCY